MMRRMVKISAGTLAVVAIAATIAACGGDGTTTGDSGDDPTASAGSPEIPRGDGTGAQGEGGRSSQRSSAARTAETRAKRGRDTNGRDGDGKPTTGDEDTDTRDRGDEDEPATTNEVVLGAQFTCSPATDGGCARADDFGAIAPGDSKTRGFFFFARREQKIAAVSIVGDGADSFRLDLGTCTIAAKIGSPPEGACALRVTFRPAVEGVHQAELQIKTESGGRGGTQLRGVGGVAQTSPQDPRPGPRIPPKVPLAGLRPKSIDPTREARKDSDLESTPSTTPE